MTRPATAGPATWPVWIRIWPSAAAAGSCSRRIRFGSAAVRVGRSIPERPAASAVSTNSGQSAGLSRSALSARPTLVAASATWVTMRSLRRSTESAMAPPANESTTSGPSETKPTMPTSNDEPVILKTWYGTATTVSWRPRNDTICPKYR